MQDVSGFDNGGFVALLGPQVSNAGAISTSAGQIILAAGSSVQIAKPGSNTTQTSNIVRTGSAVSGTLLYTPPAVSGGSLLLNDVGGVLISRRGNITLNGDAVEQLGFIEATTSITRAGSITIGANEFGPTNQVLFGTKSLTAILPEENGETIPSDPTSLASFVAPRIDVSAPYVDFQSGSWVLAPSATMSVTGPGQTSPDGSALPPIGRVLMESGSSIDLSGLTATRSVSDYIYTFKVTTNDVADAPLARNLVGQTVTIDLTQTGTRADGETWVGSPLFASSGAGYLANVAQGIDQLLTKGGSLTFGNGSSVGNGLSTPAFTDVVQAPGASINVSGGLIQYTGARIATTRVIAWDGRNYDISNADPFVTNAIADAGFKVAHPRAGAEYTEYFSDALHGSSYDKPGYFNGISAGGISITAVNPVLEGDLGGEIVIGTNQRRLAQRGTGAGGAQATPDQLPSGASLSIALKTGINLAVATDVVLADNGPGYPRIDFHTGIGANPARRLDHLFDCRAVGSRFDQHQGRARTVDDRGCQPVGASGRQHHAGRCYHHRRHTDGERRQHLAHRRYAPGWCRGPAGGSVTIGAHARLDVSGLWVNDSGSSAMLGTAYINGGSVSITTNSESTYTGHLNNNTLFVEFRDRRDAVHRARRRQRHRRLERRLCRRQWPARDRIGRAAERQRRQSRVDHLQGHLPGLWRLRPGPRWLSEWQRPGSIHGLCRAGADHSGDGRERGSWRHDPCRRSLDRRQLHAANAADHYRRAGDAGDLHHHRCSSGDRGAADLLVH